MPPKKRRLRQATETAQGAVSVLCFACRRTSDTTVQKGISSFFGALPPTTAAVGGPSTSASAAEDPLLCSKCRRVMDKSKPSSGLAVGNGGGGKGRVLPQIQRLRGYQRIATEQRVPFTISESDATALMRRDCELCGTPAPTEGHGLSRLCHWPDDLTRPARGGYMGPYHPANLVPACAVCNLMKGYRRPRGFVEAARHLATHRADEGDFGSYPLRFRHNISKRSRSCYISASSTHSKTHALSNEVWL